MTHSVNSLRGPEIAVSRRQCWSRQKLLPLETWHHPSSQLSLGACEQISVPAATHGYSARRAVGSNARGDTHDCTRSVFVSGTLYGVGFLKLTGVAALAGASAAKTVEVLFIGCHFLSGLARFNLCAHFLNLSCLLFQLSRENIHSFLLLSDGRRLVRHFGV